MATNIFRSYQVFGADDQILASAVDAVKTAVKDAKSHGDVQRVTLSKRGIRTDIEVGDVYVVPPSVCDNPEDFPTILLSANLRNYAPGEGMIEFQMGGLLDPKELSRDTLQQFKKVCFTNPKGDIVPLIVFAAAWAHPSAYQSFAYDEDALLSRLREVAYAAPFNPSLSSVFDQLRALNHEEAPLVRITPGTQHIFRIPKGEQDFPKFHSGLNIVQEDGGKKTASLEHRPSIRLRASADIPTLEKTDLTDAEMSFMDSIQDEVKKSVKGSDTGEQPKTYPDTEFGENRKPGEDLGLGEDGNVSDRTPDKVDGPNPKTASNDDVRMIMQIPAGQKEVFTVGDQNYIVYFDSQTAQGDSGARVPGMISGEYEVHVSPTPDDVASYKTILRQHISPGKPGGMQQVYAAEQVVQAILRHVNSHPKQAAEKKDEKPEETIPVTGVATASPETIPAKAPEEAAQVVVTPVKMAYVIRNKFHQVWAAEDIEGVKLGGYWSNEPIEAARFVSKHAAQDEIRRCRLHEEKAVLVAKDCTCEGDCACKVPLGKTAGNWFNPGTVIEQFYPELQHEEVGSPLMSQQEGAYINPFGAPGKQTAQDPNATGLAQGLDENTGGVPLRNEMGFYGPEYARNFYAPHADIPGNALKFKKRPQASADEKPVKQEDGSYRYMGATIRPSKSAKGKWTATTFAGDVFPSVQAAAEAIAKTKAPKQADWNPPFETFRKEMEALDPATAAAVSAVMEFAEAHYDDGWDTIVECMGPKDVAERLGGIVDPQQAISHMAELVGAHVSRALDSRWGEETDPELDTAKRFEQSDPRKQGSAATPKQAEFPSFMGLKLAPPEHPQAENAETQTFPVEPTPYREPSREESIPEDAAFINMDRLLKGVVGAYAAQLIAAYKATTKPVHLGIPFTDTLDLHLALEVAGGGDSTQTQVDAAKSQFDQALAKLSDDQKKVLLNNAVAQAAVWCQNTQGSGGFNYEVFVRAESLEGVNLTVRVVTGVK